jgi:carboxypeptidase Q
MKLTDILFQLKAGSKVTTFIAGAMLCGSIALAQAPNKAVIDAIMKEGTQNSQLEKTGPRTYGWHWAEAGGNPPNKKCT